MDMMDYFSLVIEPDQQDQESAEVLVDAIVDGRKRRFLLDTGAARTRVRFDEYSSKFEKVGTDQTSGVFSTNQSDLIRVPTIKLGPILEKDVTIARASKNGHDTRNIFGMDILKNYCCHFLFDDKRVKVDLGNERDTDHIYQDLILGKRFHPYVDVNLGSLRGRAIWDTGSGITVVDLSFAKQYPSIFSEAGLSVGTDSSGTTMATPIFMMSPATIGRCLFPSRRVAGADLTQVNSGSDLHAELILGYDLLKKTNWIFDFPHKKWAILNPTVRE